MNGIIKFLKRDIPYLASTRSRLLFIAFIAVFSAIFISLYDPFHLDHWGENLYLQFVFRGTAILLISQFLLRPLFDLRKFVFYKLVIWSVVEIALLSLVFYFFYGEQASGLGGVVYQIFDTFAQVGLIVIVPYVLFIWYSEFRLRLSEFEKIQAGKDSSHHPDPKKLLVFHSLRRNNVREKEKIIFAIKFGQLIYIKSAGNYLEIYYRKGNETTREVIRASLKDLDDKIIGTGVIKTHRSYLVNIQHISSFKKTRKGYTLVVNHVPDILVPVSSGYKKDFEIALQQSKYHS